MQSPSITRIAVVLIVFCGMLSCARTKYKNPHIEIQTKQGDIVVELFPEQAPKTVAAFLKFVDSGMYKNSSFYRVLSQDNQPIDAEKTELIQGGVYKTNYSRSARLPGIPHETTKKSGLLHKNGTLSLARLEPGTATTEFFICIGDQPGLDYGGGNNPDKQGYAAFGRVVKGMEVVLSIHHHREYEQAFDPPVAIYDIKRL